MPRGDRIGWRLGRDDCPYLIFARGALASRESSGLWCSRLCCVSRDGPWQARRMPSNGDGLLLERRMIEGDAELALRIGTAILTRL